MTREEFKQQESEEIERICTECPNYMDDNSTDSRIANSMLAKFYSRIIEQMFNEVDEAKKLKRMHLIAIIVQMKIVLGSGRRINKAQKF